VAERRTRHAELLRPRGQEAVRVYRPRVLWHAIGDPWGEASGASTSLDERAKRIAFADPLVRSLLAGRRYAFNPSALWSKCQGGTIGAVINFTFARATLKADWPQVDYDPKSHTAYVERTIRYEIANVTQLQVNVDTNRRKVVGVDPTLAAAVDGPDPKVDYFTFRPVTKAVPAGGPDSGDCSSHGD
jgi:hypothetical protein